MSQQGTLEWRIERMGHVTASRFADVLTPGRAKGVRFGKTAMSYLQELLTHYLLERPTGDFQNYDMRRGLELEPEARKAIEDELGMEARTCGFIKHASEFLIGASPDVLIGEDTTVQIKCLTAEKHLAALRDNIPDDYDIQAAGDAWVCGRRFAKYASYHPDFMPGLKLAMIDVDVAILDVGKILEFRDMLLKEHEALKPIEKRIRR